MFEAFLWFMLGGMVIPVFGMIIGVILYTRKRSTKEVPLVEDVEFKKIVLLGVMDENVNTLDMCLLQISLSRDLETKNVMFQHCLFLMDHNRNLVNEYKNLEKGL